LFNNNNKNANKEQKLVCLEQFHFYVSDLFRNACNRGSKERDTNSSIPTVMMNNNILIDSARPKVLPGEESVRSSEDNACLGQKYKNSFGEFIVF